MVHGLIRAARVSDGTEKWAEGRRDCIRALTSVVVGQGGGVGQETVPYVYDCFLLAMEDYTVDRRGDIGAWVREAAMAGIEAVTLDLLDRDVSTVPAAIIAQVKQRSRS